VSRNWHCQNPLPAASSALTKAAVRGCSLKRQGHAEEVVVAHYHHTQRVTLMQTTLLLLVVLLGGLNLILEIFQGERLTGIWFGGPISVFLCGLMWLRSSLTVEVSDTEIRWYFPRGLGLWDYRVALSDIESVRIVRNTWPNGFGIRRRPGWRLYNVSAFDAVELRLKTGDIRQIGTDDPQGLAAALTGSGIRAIP
jgi:hypothetical protein